MKINSFLMTVFAVAFLFVANANAATPALYCVSTKTYSDNKNWPVNQINIFTDGKGKMRMSLQFHAWGQSEEEDATITTPTLLTLSNLSFNEKSQELKNANGKFVLVLGKEISSTEAEGILNAKKVSFSFEDPAGMLVEFKKYHLAKLSQFSYPGKVGEWSSTLMDAHKNGVNEYVCGDIRDVR